jgi:hypothetical protein
VKIKRLINKLFKRDNTPNNTHKDKQQIINPKLGKDYYTNLMQNLNIKKDSDNYKG